MAILETWRQHRQSTLGPGVIIPGYNYACVPTCVASIIIIQHVLGPMQPEKTYLNDLQLYIFSTVPWVRSSPSVSLVFLV
jgi:hypothetical protein